MTKMEEREVRDAIFEKYYIVDDLYDEVEIKNIEKSIEHISYVQADTVSNDPDDDYRVSSVKWIPFENDWIYERIWEHSNIANNELWGFDVIGFKDSAQFTKYTAPTGKYDFHLDINGEGINHRKISIICPLNDDFEGGGVEFKTGRDTHALSLKKGQAVIFPSFFLHRVLPITKGVRKSLVQWVSGEPYR